MHQFRRPILISGVDPSSKPSRKTVSLPLEKDDKTYTSKKDDKTPFRSPTVGFVEPENPQEFMKQNTRNFVRKQSFKGNSGLMTNLYRRFSLVGVPTRQDESSTRQKLSDLGLKSTFAKSKPTPQVRRSRTNMVRNS